jgi:NTE family protein
MDAHESRTKALDARQDRQDRQDKVIAVEAFPAGGFHRGVRYGHGGQREQPSRWGYHTAFVLSGGGARGALQVGALRALLEFGEHPDAIVGTSVGAWNGAWLARAPTIGSVRELEAVWKTIRASQVLLGRDLPASAPQHALRGMLLFNAARRMVRGSASLYSDLGMRQLLTRLMGELTFADLALPFRVVATDLTHGCLATLSEGRLVEAILASSAMPGVFAPVRIGETAYSDGGTLDCCSLETALQMGARRIFLLAIGYDTDADGGEHWTCEAASSEEGMRATMAEPPLAMVLERSAQVLNRFQLERALERLPRGIEAHVICLSTGSGRGTLDFTHVPEWIEQGYQTTRAYLQANLGEGVSIRRNAEEHEGLTSAL